jgi:hypothetical protein
VPQVFAFAVFVAGAILLFSGALPSWSYISKATVFWPSILNGLTELST